MRRKLVTREWSAPPYKTHDCIARGCTVQVGPGTLMCTPHWRLLPVALRHAIYDAWEERQRYGRQLVVKQTKVRPQYDTATALYQQLVTTAVQLVEDTTQEATSHATSQRP